MNGEEAVMERILPLIAKYGAAVVCLTLDENGIPATADGRFEIAKKIMNRALSYGIPKENILIDCLVLTVSAEQHAAMETLKALHRVKTELGLKTVLGVSNISFGLPNRLNINTSFFTMALYAGLDLPIMNPNLAPMMWAFKSYKVLAAIDENSLDFISYSADHEPETVQLKNVNICSLGRSSVVRALRTGTDIQSGTDGEQPGGPASCAGSDPDCRSSGRLQLRKLPRPCACEGRVRKAFDYHRFTRFRAGRYGTGCTCRNIGR